MTPSLMPLIGLVLLLVTSLAWSASASTQQSDPIITTPTPTAAPINWQAFSNALFIPMLVHEGGGAATEINPDTFTYVVQPGDTLWSLALNFSRDLDTMACATRARGDDAATLTPGETITIPSLHDLCYTAVRGDSLAGIAARHGLSVEDVVAIAWNEFAEPPYSVEPRRRILLPGVKPAAIPRADRRLISKPSDSWAQSPWPDWPYGDGHFEWPVRGGISQDAHPGHYAIDIAVPVATEVRAADRGRVVMAGWSPVGYGFRVVIDHGNDYLTLYAHLSDIFVEEGDIVGKSQVIGLSGANGNVTGPHLHFEIRDFGILIDPLPLLTRE